MTWVFSGSTPFDAAFEDEAFDDDALAFEEALVFEEALFFDDPLAFEEALVAEAFALAEAEVPARRGLGLAPVAAVLADFRPPAFLASDF